MERKSLIERMSGQTDLIKLILAFLVFCFFLTSTTIVQVASAQPYPPSEIIESIDFDASSHVSAASGSDLWPNTWASDGNIYVSWGDGTGFGDGGNGWDTSDRVAMGFARIEWGPTNFVAYNVNGGQNSENPASFPCECPGRECACAKKSGGILSVDGTLYAWINMQDDTWPNVDHRLAWSDDLAATWTLSTWSFPKGDGNFKAAGFVDFGRDYAGARDGYVYFLGWKQGDEGNHYMGRVPKESLKDKNAYQYFTGLGGNGEPTWSYDVSKIQPYFSDPNGAWGGIVYNPVIERYIQSGTHGTAEKLGIFDAPEPWGPWTTVAYYNNWLGLNGGESLVYQFANKWTSADGLTMWMIFSCYDCASQYHDRFNLVKATLTLKSNCGNGVVETGEECDDGDTSNGDGCSSSCTVESGWKCSREPSYCMYGVPYPPSEIISNIAWDFDNLIREAYGSDIWPVTWGPDNNIYTGWGDGVGFGAVDYDEQWGPDRDSLGFSRIEGQPTSFTAANVWGGKNAENPATFTGKCGGMLSVDGTLYGWILLQDGTPAWQIAWSSDLGATWQKVDWKWSGTSGTFYAISFLNFGRDYEGARDGFVYIYGPTSGSPSSRLDLARVPKDQVKDRAAYEFFKGLDVTGNPTWTADVTERQPVFTDPNGGGDIGGQVVYNPAIGRYLMVISRGEVEQFGMFDAPEPWGPWSTAAYYDDWGGEKWGDFGYEGGELGYHPPTKWISTDGKVMWFVFSGYDPPGRYLDSFNLVKATLTLASTFPITIEAEDMDTSNVVGEAVTDGWGLLQNGYIEDSVYFPSSEDYKFDVVARSDYAGGAWAEMEIRIDQNPIATITVDSDTWQTFSAEGFVSAGTHDVAIAFINNYYSSPEDRNLYVDKIIIDETVVTPYCGDGNCDPGEYCGNCLDDCACTGADLCCNDQCITPACSQPSDCGSDPCKTYTCSNPGTCSASCSFQEITTCSGLTRDGCCPAGCTEDNDEDCRVTNCNGLVLLMHLDNQAEYGESPSQMYDFSGIGNNGSCDSASGYCPTWNATGCYFAGGFEFDGTNDYIDCESDESLDMLGPLTYSIWLKPTDTGNSYPRVLFKGSGSTNGNRLFIDRGSSNDRLIFRVDYATNDLTRASPLNSISWGEWQHWAVTWNGSVWAEGVRIYKNGYEVSSYSDTSDASGGRVDESNYNLMIGNDNAVTSYEYTGTIDEVAIWKRSLTAEEILDLYNSGAPISCELQTYHRADNNPQDGCVDTNELLAFIDLWKHDSTVYPMPELMQAIGRWNSGTGC